MVIAASGNEERAWITAGAIETETVVVEHGRLFEVADVKVHVSDRGPRRHAGPDRVTGELHERSDIQRIDRPDVLTIANDPCLTRLIGIHLHAQPVRIVEVDRLAVAVIGHADLHTCLTEVCNERAEGRTIRQEHSEVIQPEQPAARHRPHASFLMELQQHRVAPMRPEPRLPFHAIDHAEADDALVEGQRSLEIRNLQPHAPDPRAVR